MSKDLHTVKRILDLIEKDKKLNDYSNQLSPINEYEIRLLEQPKYSNQNTPEGIANRHEFLNEKGFSVEQIHQPTPSFAPQKLDGNIENFIGMAQVPIGLAGPLLIKGVHAQGDFYVPLATTEGALVASYNRGMKACRLSGGITSVCLTEGVQRSPYFKFKNIHEVVTFIKWLHEQTDTLHQIVSDASRYAQLNEIKTHVEGNGVIITFEYSTGDASGQNMVTICTDQICKYILSNFEIEPREWYIEGNYSGDKKATALSFSNVRGKKVTTEIVLSKKIIAGVLKTTAQKIADYWQASTLAAVQSGSIGAQGHIANGLTAMFIACGQDVACISESSIGLTRMEATGDGDLYVSVTLPSLIVGTIGGGTGLSTQKECLDLMGCSGLGKAKKFAEICGAVALAGEISIASAMAADHFTSAHQNLGRKQNGPS
jgi:hydroxymethylglutaryl-CoA reductase (NADPH)